MAYAPWNALREASYDPEFERAYPFVPPTRETTKKPDLRVLVTSKHSISIPRRILPALLLVLIGGGLLATVWARSEMATYQMQLIATEQATATAQTAHEQLLLESSSLESPSRIVGYASSKLGMVFPNTLSVKAGSGAASATKVLILPAPVAETQLPLPAGSDATQLPPSGVPSHG
ncbi:MAG: hypothetical protein HKL81_08655 [Acidimicrobiaceae bacterium]|nr:hypothetical protein [Acidimicrobiaceae bacterium]